VALRTVRVPDGMKALFSRAEAVVSRFFREREDHPERGTLEIFGARYSPDTSLLDGIAHAALITKPFRTEALTAKLREILTSV